MRSTNRNPEAYERKQASRQKGQRRSERLFAEQFQVSDFTLSDEALIIMRLRRHSSKGFLVKPWEKS